MSVLEAVVLAVIQGLTEFLPVSSSGHLVLTKAYMATFGSGEWAALDDIAFDVIVHFGTFLAVFVIFWKDIKEILTVFFTGILKPSELKTYAQEEPLFNYAILLIIGMIPAGIVGLSLKDEIEHLFAQPKMVGGILILTGIILFSTRFAPKEKTELTWKKGLMIGLAQAFALIPGISRSGSTISTAILLGIPQKDAARYSFIMVLPLILGATLLTVLDVIEQGISSDQLNVLFIGLVVSFVVGYISLKWLMKLLNNGKFYLFSFYTITVGIISLIIL